MVICISLNDWRRMCAYECSHAYLRLRLRQDCGHALCTVHAKVKALGGCERLSWRHQVKQVCWGRTRSWSGDRVKAGNGGRGGGGGRTSCHSPKKITSTGVNSLSRCWHLTSRKGIPLSKASVATRGRCYRNRKYEKQLKTWVAKNR